jgi:BrnA antitoxin of type II toxin-antitoxin system
MRPEYDFSEGKRGAVMPQKGKTRISIFIDNAVLDAFRARAQKGGAGYQTMMNEALRQHLSDAEQPVTEKILRHVLRQELPKYIVDAAPPGHTRAKGAKPRNPRAS